MACATRLYLALGSSFLVPSVGATNALDVSMIKPDAMTVKVSTALRLNAPFASFSQRAFQASPIWVTSLRHTSDPLVVGSRCPYHHPSVPTSADIVDGGTETGGDPNGCARWCVGIGWVGAESESDPGIKLDGWTIRRSLGCSTHACWIQPSNANTPAHPAAQCHVHQVLHYSGLPAAWRTQDHHPRSASHLLACRG